MDDRLKETNRYLAKAMVSILDAYINAFSLPVDKMVFRKLFRRLGYDVGSSIDEGLKKIGEAKGIFN